MKNLVGMDGFAEARSGDVTFLLDLRHRAREMDDGCWEVTSFNGSVRIVTAEEFSRQYRRAAQRKVAA